MGGKRKTSQLRVVRLKSDCADRANDQTQLQYNASRRLSQPFHFDTYERVVQRAIVDAVYLLKDWPAQIRYSYFVGPDGKLFSRGERSQAG